MLNIRIISPSIMHSVDFTHLLWLASEYSAEKLSYTITHELPQMNTIGILENASLIAFASYVQEPTRAMVEYIAVKETHQGRGLGSQLLHEISQSSPEIYLETDDDAVEFYRKQGFTVIPKDRDPRWPDRERYTCTWKTKPV
ncbi:GNAT family N-acetyltransferase [Corynebacterium crudilactis]|uniref:GNAT family N-acetyltransferase n=1 Tax=Corynebacterium crudilactis TaxID=1652495 RepID=UPI000B1FEE7F|nr:GNAT family N-acetyltransferase [Corynebacterium crudilactis]